MPLPRLCQASVKSLKTIGFLGGGLYVGDVPLTPLKQLTDGENHLCFFLGVEIQHDSFMVGSVHCHVSFPGVQSLDNNRKMEDLDWDVRSPKNVSM